MTDAQRAKVLMVMGTCSSAGKSLVATALCRCFARRGLGVAPFKAQNMSNNAAVCDGGEIGRSQALQAMAAGVPPQTDMNPVLLKPEGGGRVQVVVNGKVTPTLETREYFGQRERLWASITGALDRLRSEFEVVVIEGAGSPAELNLASQEMVNFAIARYCQSPTILVGDIERGGVFAQLLGTLWLIPEQDRELICGLLVNKFHGDRTLFDEGVEILEDRAKVPVLGVLPWIEGLDLPAEDAEVLNQISGDEKSEPSVLVDMVVIQLPHISNFDDFDPLAAEPGVRLRYAKSVEQIHRPQVILLPGTKNTISDLLWLKESGISDRIIELADQGVTVIGICGGYQMLGKSIDNPDALESEIRSVAGLALLDIDTRYYETKQTRWTTCVVTDDRVAPGTLGQTVRGYEIHVGQSRSSQPWLETALDQPVDAGADGASARDGQIWGCYLHGLFDNDSFRRALLEHLGVSPTLLISKPLQDRLQHSIDRLADALERFVDVDRLLEVVMKGPRQPRTSHG